MTSRGHRRAGFVDPGVVAVRDQFRHTSYRPRALWESEPADPRAAELQRAFVDWIRQMAERLAPAGAVVPPLRTLEDVRMTLVERVAGWPKQLLREGREQGLAEGREQGIERGVDQQRALLCRMAAGRCGDDTAARLAEVVAPISDPERLAEVGDWLVRCDTAAEFLACVIAASVGPTIKARLQRKRRLYEESTGTRPTRVILATGCSTSTPCAAGEPHRSVFRFPTYPLKRRRRQGAIGSADTDDAARPELQAPVRLQAHGRAPAARLPAR